MALKECRECGQQVSSNAKNCPHCGTPHPTSSMSKGAQGCLGCLGIIVVLGVIGSLLGDPSPSSTSPSSAIPEGTSGAASSSGQLDERTQTGRLTPAQRNAFRSAQAYLRMSGFSRQGLIDQLSSEYGDQYSVADATAAVDALNVDWNAQAARSAASYLQMSGFSCQGLVDQLSSSHGEQFTVGQAREGATRAGAC